MTDFNTCLSALTAFVSQRSGIDYRSYGNREAYMDDYRPILAQGKHYRKMTSFVANKAIDDQDFIKASDQVFSGRLQFDKRLDNGEYSVNYCTGQYFPTEYRLASCWLIGRVIRNYWQECGYTYPEIKAKAIQVFGRSIASKYFN